LIEIIPFRVVTRNPNAIHLLEKKNDANRQWRGVSVSSSRQYKTAVIFTGLIYICVPSGDSSLSVGWLSNEI